MLVAPVVVTVVVAQFFYINHCLFHFVEVLKSNVVG